MKNLFNLLMISAIAASCVNLDGQLNIKQPMTVKQKSGFLNLGSKKVELEAGIYKADLKINNSKSFTLKLRLDKEDDKDISIPLKSEKELNVPANGAVRIAGTDIDQPFDLNGTIATSYSESSITRSSETCTVTTYQRRCDKVCTEVRPRDDRRDERNPRRPEGRSELRCEIVCRDVPVSLYGIRMVDYHYRYTTRNLEAEFRDPKNPSAQLATLSATGTESDRVNDYYGDCRL